MSGLPNARPKISEHKNLMIPLVLKTRYFIEKFYRGLKVPETKKCLKFRHFLHHQYLLKSLQQSKNESFILVNTT